MNLSKLLYEFYIKEQSTIKQWDQSCLTTSCSLIHPWTWRHVIFLHYERKEFPVFIKGVGGKNVQVSTFWELIEYKSKCSYHSVWWFSNCIYNSKWFHLLRLAGMKLPVSLQETLFFSRTGWLHERCLVEMVPGVLWFSKNCLEEIWKDPF